ncbi:MAG: short-chain dehydrogenase, partial [Ardenticatenaceae bacterium]
YALNGLSDALRVELQSSNIHVTSIYPGVTATRFVQRQLRLSRRRVRKRIAVPPQKVAEVIVDSIERPGRARYVTLRDRVLVALSTFLPGLAERVLAFLFRQAQR